MSLKPLKFPFRIIFDCLPNHIQQKDIELGIGSQKCFPCFIPLKMFRKWPQIALRSDAKFNIFLLNMIWETIEYDVETKFQGLQAHIEIFMCEIE